jgi:hypothetical protein
VSVRKGLSSERLNIPSGRIHRESARIRHPSIPPILPVYLSPSVFRCRCIDHHINIITLLVPDPGLAPAVRRQNSRPPPSHIRLMRLDVNLSDMLPCRNICSICFADPVIHPTGNAIFSKVSRNISLSHRSVKSRRCSPICRSTTLLCSSRVSHQKGHVFIHGLHRLRTSRSLHGCMIRHPTRRLNIT